MAKVKSGAKKAKVAPKSKPKAKLGVVKTTAKLAVKTAARIAKPAIEVVTTKKGSGGKAGKAAAADKPRPRATKLPPPGEPLTQREMEQLLTAGAGRGVIGEGSLKGRLVVKDHLPHLLVIGRDKRELTFLLQGPDQEVLPAYTDHKVSVSGLIKKVTNYGGSVDVRKYSAKKPEAEVVAPEPVEEKLKFLSPGEVEQICAAGMGAGMRGFATIRGWLEMTGEDFFLVVSNGGTRQQVSFILEGKGAKGLRKQVGQMMQVTGVATKSSGWGGSIEVETAEPRAQEHRAVSRDGMEVVEVEGTSAPDQPIEVKLNNGLIVRLLERAGFTWAIEPTMAKRMGLREANFEPSSQGQHTREFFFTPRNPGPAEIEFFLAKASNPAQVSKSFKLPVLVKA